MGLVYVALSQCLSLYSIHKLCNSLLPFLILSSYNPYDGPNEHPEAELPLVAGKYLYVYGNMDDDGFYEGLQIFQISHALTFKSDICTNSLYYHIIILMHVIWVKSL